MGFSLINHPPSRGTQETSISGRITIPTLWHRGSSSDSSELIKKRKREMKQTPKGHTAYKRVMFSLSIMKSSSINDGEFMRPLFFFALGG
jgi:hypothetical protein